MYFSGAVRCPLLDFQETELNFGVVALGFSVTKEIDLINKSVVSINYEVHIRDGKNPAIKAEDLTTLGNQVGCLNNVKEFECYPKHGTAGPEENIRLKVKTSCFLIL